MPDPEAVPSWLTGAWERLWVSNDHGPIEDTVNVRNIQTPTLFGDVRIPKDRPRFPKAKSLRDLTDAELKTLYPQEGFSGYTTTEGYVVTWHHEISFQPPDGSIDIGRAEFTGGRNMFEHGVQSVYLEHWWHLASGDGYFLGVQVMRKLPGGAQRIHELLSVAGDHFIYARNRPFDLPMAPSMAALIKETHADRQQILAYLDCEVSHGFVLGGSFPWEIQFSTLPYRQGEALAFASLIEVDPRTGQLSHRGELPDQVWSFPVNTIGVEDLLVMFPPKRRETDRGKASTRGKSKR
jgi:hypothetical protein